MTDPLEAYSKHLQRNSAYRKRRTANERKLVLDHYGAECVCCGETGEKEHIAVFPVDNTHKYQVLAERGKGWSPAGFNHMLVTESFPEGFETRCVRCHRFMKGGNGCACGGKRTPIEG